MSPNADPESTESDDKTPMSFSDEARSSDSLENRPGDVVADIIPYVVPMFAYVGLSGLESYVPHIGGHPSPSWYPLAYAVKLVIVMFLAWRYRSTWRNFRPAPTVGAVMLAVITGLLVWGLWIGLDGWYLALPVLGHPRRLRSRSTGSQRSLEFHRRQDVGIGDRRPVDRRAVLAVVLDALVDRRGLLESADRPGHAHGRWRHVDLVCTRTSRVAAGAPDRIALGGPALADRLTQHFAISHATANLALGIYVIVTGNWKFW